MNQYPIDGGPVYTETDLSSLLVEPWNAISSFAIILPAIYWAFKLRFALKKFAFIYLCILLLVIGGMGSLLYHAFRSSSLLLVMDVLPAALLTALIGIYFWFKIIPKWYQTLFIIAVFTVLRFSLFDFLPSELAVNIGYFISGAMFFLPILIYLRQHQFRHTRDIFLSIAFLLLSLLFRELDQALSPLLPMGSHFLWHLFSGVGAYFLGNFLYKFRIEELENSTKDYTE